MSRAAHLEEAAEHARKGRWSKAIDGYRLVLADEPDNAELRVMLADAYRRVKNDERAFHHFHRSATLFLAKGDPARAAGALIEANAITPNVPDVLWRLCEALKALGRGDDLVPYLVALIRAAPAPGDRRRLWALEELFALHPDDLSVAQQRAEALAEADRIDESVLAYKKLASRLGQREAELVQVLFRAAKIAVGRSDLGADIAGVLLAHGRAKDALAVIVGFYEKTPDDLAVLETLLRCLEALGATEKAIAARVELVKARAAAGSRSQVLVEVDALLAAAPEDPVALEVSAHALALVREPSRAQELWRRLLKVAERRGLRAERDRAIAAVLKSNPDDEDALELAIQMHAAAARFQESDALRQRLLAVRALKKRSLMAAPAKLENKRLSVPAPPTASSPHGQAASPHAQAASPVGHPPSPLGQAGLPDDVERTGTMVLSDEDVLDVRGSERIHDEVPERSDATPLPSLETQQARERADTLRPTPTPTPVLTPAMPPALPPKAKTPVPPASTFEIPLPSNPWFEGRERRKASATQLGTPGAPSPRRETQPPQRRVTQPPQRARTDDLPGGVRERRTQVADPASYGPSGEETGEDIMETRAGEVAPRNTDPSTRAARSMRALPPSAETAPLPAAGAHLSGGDSADEMTWEADEPTTMDTQALKHLRNLTENVAVQDLGPATLPGELTHPGFTTRPAAMPQFVDDLELDSVDD